MRIVIDTHQTSPRKERTEQKVPLSQWRTIVPVGDQAVFQRSILITSKLSGRVKRREECDHSAATAEAIRLGIVFPWKEVATLQLFINIIKLAYTHLPFHSARSNIDSRVSHELGSVIRPALILLQLLSEAPTVGQAAKEEVGRASLIRTVSETVPLNDQYTRERTLLFSARIST
jgi:hypothetical protein